MSEATRTPVLKKLEGPSDWTSWHTSIINKIRLTAFKTMVTRNKDRPVQVMATPEMPATDTTPAQPALEGEAITDYAQRLLSWQDEQDSAYAYVHEFCGTIAANLLDEAANTNMTIFEAINIKLRAEFKHSGSGRYQDLCHQLMNLRLDNCTNVVEYSSKFTQLHDEMIKISPQLALPGPFQVQHYLNGLGESFNQFITSFNLQESLITTTINGIVKPEVTIAETRRKVEEHAQRAATINNSHIALYQQQQGKGQQPPHRDRPLCKICKKYHNGTCWTLDPSKAPAGWIARSQLLPKKRKTSDSSNKPDVIFESSADSGEHRMEVFLQDLAPMSLFTSSAAYFSSHSETSEYMAIHRGMNLYDRFILDSGASGHIIGRKDIFMPGTYKDVECPLSKGIGDSTLKAIGMGTIRLKCSNSRWMQVKNVQYSPLIGVNLLSLSKLWPQISTISKSKTGLTFSQAGVDEQFSASITNDLLFLDIHQD